MGFNIVDLPDSPTTKQEHVSTIYSTDLKALTDGIDGDGVVTGCAATEKGTPTMVYDIASGTVVINGVEYSVSATTATIGTADASNPRWDLITINTSGAAVVTAGTADANPEPPSKPADQVILYRVYVAANDTAAADNDNLTDLRVSVPAAKTNMSVLTLRESGGTDMNAASTNNVMPWDIQDKIISDTFAHDTVTNNSRITLKQAGHYFLTCSINLENSVTSNFRYNGRVKVRINGTTTLNGTSQTGYIRQTSGQTETSLVFSIILTDISANDYIEILVDREVTSSGAADTVANTSHLSCFYLAGAGTVASAGYDTVEDDGVAVTARTTLNFEHPLTVTDVSGKTLVTLGNGALINIAENTGLIPVDGTYEDIPFDTENLNSDDTRIDFTTSGADITFLKAGLYEVVIASFISGASGVGSMRLRRSTDGGSNYTTHGSVVTYSVASNVTPINSWTIEVVVDEQIKFEIQEDSGTLNLLYSEVTAKRH